MEDFREILRQKKAGYNDLKEKIYSPLNSNIVTSIDSRPEEIPSLIFDPLRVRQSEPNHFEKAKKHFKKIQILKRFEELEKDVITFNENLDIEDKKITEIVSNYLKGKGFEISTDNSISIKENTILINYLIPALKLFWRRKMFDNFQEQLIDETGKKELRIKGALIIVVPNKDKENEIRECTECLKNNQIINEKYDNIRVESDRIMEEANKLSSTIKRRLIDEYKK